MGTLNFWDHKKLSYQFYIIILYNVYKLVFLLIPASHESEILHEGQIKCKRQHWQLQQRKAKNQRNFQCAVNFNFQTHTELYFRGRPSKFFEPAQSYRPAAYTLVEKKNQPANRFIFYPVDSGEYLYTCWSKKKSSKIHRCHILMRK